MGKRGKGAFVFAIAVLFVVFLSANVLAAANPSAVYCSEMGKQFGGYKYVLTTDENGNQDGNCILPDDLECEGWDFLKGKCGVEQSYCAKKGYDSKVKKEGLYCRPKNMNELSESERSAFSAGDEVAVEELIDLRSKLGGKVVRSPSKALDFTDEGTRSLLGRSLLGESYNITSFSYWDWRIPPNGTEYSQYNFSYFDTTQGWVTSVKDQGSCGSCWSFSVDAAIEAKYEIVKNNSRLNLDLSEQNSISCDTTCNVTGGSTYCQDGCTGGYLDVTLQYIKTTGTVDDSCFTYSSTSSYSPSCSNKCSDYSNRLWTVTDYHTTWMMNPSPSINQTKQFLLEQGPLSSAIKSTGLYPGGGNPDSYGIYRCADDNGADHAVLLVGYNDTGNIGTSYWIIKNSWGTGVGDSGYYKVGFNECNITSEFDWAYSVTAPANYKPWIVLNSPAANNATANGSMVSFNFSVYTKNATTAKCDLLINNLTRNYTSSMSNASSAVFAYNVTSLSTNWSIECWEDGFGITNRSETRALYTDNTIPFVNISSPSNNQNLSSKTISISFTATDGEVGINYANISVRNKTGGEVFNSTINDGSGNYAVNISVNNDGNYSVYAVAYDFAGNSNTTSVNFTIDSTPPYVAFASPANISYATRQVTVNITNSSDAQAVWWFNGTANLSYSEAILNYNFSEGSNVIYAYVNDSLGNLNTTSVTFTADTTAPLITIISPANNSWYNSGVFNVSINEEGDCNYSTNDGGLNYTMNRINSTSLYSVNSSLSAGNYNVTYYCNDSVGNKNITMPRVYFNIDLTAPNVTSISPADDYSASGTQTVNFQYNVTDNLNFTRCALIVSGSILAYNSTLITNGTNTISQELGVGSYGWSINCTDSAGNIGNSSTKTMTLSAVTQPPSSSGGGGGGGGATVYQVTREQISTGYTKEFSAGDKIEFAVPGETGSETAGNAGSAEIAENVTSSASKHSVTIDKIGADSVNLTIRSNIVKLTLFTGQEAKLNLSSAEFYDLYVKLESILNKKANLTIKNIREQITSIVPAENRTAVTGKVPSEKSDEVPSEELGRSAWGNTESNWKINLFIALLIIAMGVLFVIYYKEKHELEMNYYYRYGPKEK